MKAKNYILFEIKNILIDRKDFTNEEAETWLKDYENNSFVELLNLKQTLLNSKREFKDSSFRTTIWPKEDY